MKRALILPVILAMLLTPFWHSFASAQGAPAPRADYQFQNTLASSVSGAPALTNLGSNTFASETVDGASRTVLRFPTGSGVVLSAANGVIGSGGAYTIAVIFRLETVDSFRRILDFRNGTSDNGLYAQSGVLRFFGIDAANSNTNAVPANTYVQVVLTRDSSKNLVGYVNGARQWTATDPADQAVPDGANTVRFFRDNGSEHSAGAVARLRVWDRALNATEVSSIGGAGAVSPPPASTPVPTPPPSGEAAAIAGTYLGKIADRVGKEAQMTADGTPDGVFSIEVTRSGSHRITFLDMRAAASGRFEYWDTRGDTTNWVLGITDDAEGAPILNRSDTSIDVSLTNSRRLRLYANESANYFGGELPVTITVCFDGVVADCVSKVVTTSSSTPPSPPSGGSCVALPAGAVSWWAAEGNASDLVGGNNGTLQGGASFSPGRVGQAFRLDGSSGHVTMGNPSNLKLANAITIEAWVNPAAAPPSGDLSLSAIVTKWAQSFANSSTSDAYGLWLQSEGGSVRLFSSIHKAGGGEPQISGGTVPLNTWTHVATTFDASSGQYLLYVNGQQVAATSSPGPLFATDRNVLIGREDSFLPRPFNGLIDEVAIYSRALSATELQSIVAAGGAGKCQSGTPPTTPPITPPTTPPSGGTGGSRAVFIPTMRNNFSDPTFGGTWLTGLQVYNLDKNAAANITLKYVRPDGSTAATISSSGIEANGSLTFFGNSTGVTEGFNGSVVITADRSVVVITNQLSQDTGQSGSYNGIAAVGKTVYLPAVQRGGEGGHTSLSIQNAGSAATSRLSVKFFRVNESAPVVTRTLASLPAGAAVELAQDGMTDLPDGFRGSAVVEADQDLAVVVNQSNGKSLLSSTGRPTGAATLYGPLVMNNNGGFNSAVQVQNVGSSATQVTINVRNALTGATLPAQTRTVAPGAATSWPMSELAGAERLVGSVTVSAAAGGAIIGVVQQVNADSNQGSAYGLFTSGSSSLVAPLVQTSNSGWNSGFQVQNIGTSNATVTLSVVDTARNVVAVPDATQTLAPGQSFTWFPVTALGTRMVGAATVAGSAGSVLVGVANQLNQESGAVDFFMTYEGIGQ